jgi:hypothetical protein
MRLTGLLFAAASVLSMIAAPAFAQPPANPAARLSLTAGGASTDVRAGAPMKKSSKFAFTAPTVLLGLAVVGTVVGVAVATSHSDNHPASA